MRLEKIFYSSHFIRAVKKLPGNLRRTIFEKEKLFLKNCFGPGLKTHKLTGKLKNYWAFSVNYEYRVLFRFISATEVMFTDIGDHSIYQ